MHNYRENGKVKHKVISNLSSWPSELIDQFEALLKGNKITKLEDLNYTQGKAYGAIKIINEIAEQLGIKKALGSNKQGNLCMLMIMGRILTNGSRLHLCNWAQDQAIEDVLNISNFNEDDLYSALDWICDNQKKIEKKLFVKKNTTKIEELFLYDITSTYLEGELNELAAYGYNRDGKKGKKQIVVGLMTDKDGTPVSIEVFKGNMQDSKTVISQIKKLANDFGVKKVIFVGDRGMIKKSAIEEITEENWHYITAITKPQIEKLIEDNVIQLGLFDENLHEVEHKNIRYILRRNNHRKEEIQKNRELKIEYINKKIEEKNKYLEEHKKSQVESAKENIEKIIKKLKMQEIIKFEIKERKIEHTLNKEELEKKSLLDGCYVLTTDIPCNQIDKEIIHKRYKDLYEVEKAFRTIKTGLLEIRPIFLRKEKRTRGHVFICMLSYMITKYIWEKLKELEIQQEYIFQTLDKIQYIIYNYKNKEIKILPSEYTEIQNKILSGLNIKLPVQL